MGKIMEKTWKNHGKTMEKPILGQSGFGASGGFLGIPRFFFPLIFCSGIFPAGTEGFQGVIPKFLQVEAEQGDPANP